MIDPGKFDWVGAQVPELPARSPYHGLNFFETFGDMAYTFHCHAVGTRSRPQPGAVQRLITMLGIETLRMERPAPMPRRSPSTWPAIRPSPG